MPFCPNCGVEIVEGADTCPLCRSPVQPRPPHPAHLVDEILEEGSKEKLTKGEWRLIVWEVISVSAGIIALSTCAINLLLDARLSWALYPLLSLAFLWLIATSWRFFHDRRPVVVALVMVLIPLLLVALDLVGGRPSWSFSIALPISLLVEAAVSAGLWLFFNVKGRGANSLAFLLILVAIVCLGIEATLDIAGGKRLGFEWSAIVAFCLLPAAAFFFYLHYRIRRKTTLRRFFHL
jgi:hypothetical protein